LKLCRHLGHSAAFVNNSNSQSCLRCTSKFEFLSFTEEQIKLLKDNITSAAFEEHIFANSNPPEYNNFKRFVSKCRPFDIVVDGLNVMLHHSTDGSVSRVKKLLAFLGKLRDQHGFRNILVIVREHVMRSIAPDRFKWVSFYSVRNDSQDDLFLLYAALHSGPKCCIATRDLLTNYSQTFAPEIAQLFVRWRQAHQVQFVQRVRHQHNNSGSGEEWAIELPNLVSMRPQQLASGWHVPFVHPEQLLVRGNLASTWLCTGQPVS